MIDVMGRDKRAGTREERERESIIQQVARPFGAPPAHISSGTLAWCAPRPEFLNGVGGAD
ncbi:unnamed protein product [Ectocarpus sp. 12 AP-2014]